MRVLFVSPRQAVPANSGAKLRDFYLARALGHRSELTYVHYSDPTPAANTEGFEAETVIAVPRPRGYTLGKLIRGVFGPWPISVENYLSPEMRATLDKLVASKPFDLVHLDAIQMAGYEPLLASAGLRIVYDWHNIESELMERFGAHVESAAKRLYARYTARRLGQLERKILGSAFGHLVCSPRERDQLLALAPEARIAVIPNGVDTAYFDLTPSPTERNRLVFVGSMSYHANIDAAVQFTHHIWPRIHARFRHFRLTIVGSNPTPEVQALGRLEGVEVTGSVDDIRPYYAQAFAALVPLLVGGGTRLKILEAMAARVPVISTPVGAEGLDVSAGENILIACGPQDWESSIASLLDTATADRMTRAGRHLAERHYDWNMLGGQLYDLYSRWLRGLS